MPPRTPKKKPTAKKPTPKKPTPKKLVAGVLVVGTRRRPAQAAGPKISAARLKELVEEATVDAYNESERRVGFLTMIQDNLEVPFETDVLGVPVQVTSVDFNDADEIVAICTRGPQVQPIPVLDLPLPDPPPQGVRVDRGVPLPPARGRMTGARRPPDFGAARSFAMARTAPVRGPASGAWLA